ncbi:MAG: DEAD/DEAH box helicase [Acidobacteria bacterium]|nr:DEAD/DEAH box helicase [Acidobacteriota bacterium]
MNSFDRLGLSAEILRAVAEQKYTQPTPIQAQAIPVVLSGRDLMAGAQTGTGKTAGFTLPILQSLSSRRSGEKRSIRCLVLAPTRELAAQIGASMSSYGKYLPFRSAVVFGGVNINRQTQIIKSGVDILVATPGRLLDHMGRGNIDLKHLEVLVLDEADRMLDMGFIHDIKRIMAVLPKERQTLLFSATFSDGIKKLAQGLLRNPETVQVATQNKSAEGVQQSVCLVEKAHKREFLQQMITTKDWQQVLVFTRTKRMANQLAKFLNAGGIQSLAIHGNKSQSARTSALSSFKGGKTRVLVATDIAARGLDIKELPYVVNFELPDEPEAYVHRVGRTGRAGQRGLAISLVSVDEQSKLRDIERLTKQQIARETMPNKHNRRDVTSTISNKTLTPPVTEARRQSMQKVRPLRSMPQQSVSKASSGFAFSVFD